MKITVLESILQLFSFILPSISLLPLRYLVSFMFYLFIFLFQYFMHVFYKCYLVTEIKEIFKLSIYTGKNLSRRKPVI